jgi:hypothetical protein
VRASEELGERVGTRTRQGSSAAVELALLGHGGEQRNRGRREKEDDRHWAQKKTKTASPNSPKDARDGHAASDVSTRGKRRENDRWSR